MALEIDSGKLKVIEDDPSLAPYKSVFDHRLAIYKNWIQKINDHEGGIDEFTRGYQKLGMNIFESQVVYREWAPGVKSAFLTGDFSNYSY